MQINSDAELAPLRPSPYFVRKHEPIRPAHRPRDHLPHTLRDLCDAAVWLSLHWACSPF